MIEMGVNDPVKVTWSGFAVRCLPGPHLITEATINDLKDPIRRPMAAWCRPAWAV